MIMIRTSLQPVGDPLEGLPNTILLARAQGYPLTLQNQPMVAGRWDATEGFLVDADAWEKTDRGTLQAKAPDAALSIAWDGDLRRYREFFLRGSASEGNFAVYWRNLAGEFARQPLVGSGGLFSTNPSLPLTASDAAQTGASTFDGQIITAFFIKAPNDTATIESIGVRPKRITLINFIDVWRADNFSRYTLNSLLVAVAVTLGSVVTSLCAGYAFARGQTRLRQVLWAIMLGTMLIPSQVLLIPAFLIFQNFPLFGGNDWLGRGGIGLLDSYSGLILPNLVLPLGVFLVRQSLLSIPDSYEEAAVIDGATIPQLLWHVIAPLQRPILATVALLAFLFNWNSFIFPLILIQTPEMRTLPVALALYSARDTVDWVSLMAASTLTALPIFVLFLFFQKQLIAGLVHEGVKG